MKKFLLSLMIVCSAFMLSSCIIVLEDDASTDRGTVNIENRDPIREDYISKVEYCRSDSEKWFTCWTINDYGTDSSCNFRLRNNYYKIRITVIYPEYDGYNDYYETFELWDSIYVSSSTSVTLIYDGEDLFVR